MIDRVSPCWTRNVTLTNPSSHNNGGGLSGNANINSSPGSSSVLTMESLDSLEGFESESGFIASRPCMAEIMNSGGGGGVGNGLQGNTLLSAGVVGGGGHLTPLSLSHSSAMHPHMSPSNSHRTGGETNPSTPPNLNNASMNYGGVPHNIPGGVVGPMGDMVLGPSSGAPGNVPEYPWMKEKKTTRKNSHQGSSKWHFLLLFTPVSQSLSIHRSHHRSAVIDRARILKTKKFSHNK